MLCCLLSAYGVQKDTALVQRPFILWCAPVVRRASCRLQRQPAPRVSRGTSALALAIAWEVGTTLKLFTRPHRATLGLVDYAYSKGTASARGLLIFDARLQCDVPAAPSNVNQRLMIRVT